MDIPLASQLPRSCGTSTLAMRRLRGTAASCLLLHRSRGCEPRPLAHKVSLFWTSALWLGKLDWRVMAWCGQEGSESRVFIGARRVQLSCRSAVGKESNTTDVRM
ncbi:hypothetical protein IE81DRAFT_323524 [Ceraceosorus guamensis]|uniref:Uncharacterized protein n=1 Tax=Ceraceosorus guamensis TaxID=1522189 RepID=A0A316W0W2_9BASI|nr:hypothetical protein IE81DRAFT_323524 [Ceraceosorus guamensis]PWN42373.1 hypothetical protein IE81DRAFT_323524 [Ceraceosorus guamensis]